MTEDGVDWKGGATPPDDSREVMAPPFTAASLMAMVGGRQVAGVTTEKRLLLGDHLGHKDRGISARTAKACGCLSVTWRGRPAWAYEYKAEGKTVAQHVRLEPKDFIWLGREKGQKLELFNQHQGGNDTVVVVEGELDCLSLMEVFTSPGTVGLKGSWTAVSIPDGAAACEEPLKRNINWLKQFRRVVLWFDQDDAGRQGIDKALQVLDSAAVVEDATYKDPNEALMAGDRAAIVRALQGAQTKAPDGVIWAMAPEVLNEVFSPTGRTGIQFPWQGWNRMTKGLRQCDLMVLSAGTKVGKSAFTRAMGLHWLLEGRRGAYLGLEEPAWMSLERMLSIVMQTDPPLYADTEEQRAARDMGPIMEALDTFAPHLFLIDKWRDQSFPSFARACRHYVNELGCEWIVLDHFSWLAAKMPGSNKQDQIERCITELKELVNELRTRLIVVTHLSRDDRGQDPEEGGRPKLSMLRGSQALAQVPNFVVMLQRNPRAEDPVERNTTTCWMEANRLTGESGEMSRLIYQRSGDFYEIPLLLQ
jgi:twinkle protein